MLVAAGALALPSPAAAHQVEFAIGVVHQPARGVIPTNGDVMTAAIRGRHGAVMQDPKGQAKALVQLCFGPRHTAGGDEPPRCLEFYQGSGVGGLLGGVAMALHDQEVIKVVFDAWNTQKSEVHGNGRGLAVAPASRAIVGLVKEGQPQGDGALVRFPW